MASVYRTRGSLVSLPILYLQPYAPETYVFVNPKIYSAHN